MNEQWDLLLTLPNLAPSNPTPFESDGYVICAGNDGRLSNLADNAGNATAMKMLGAFTTARGESYTPGCFLVRSDIPIYKRDVEAIRAFRNLAAIATVTPAYAHGLANPAANQCCVTWSDQFLLGYFVAGQNGWVQTLGGAAGGMDNEIPRQQPAAQFANRENWSLAVDQPLLGRLFRCWRTCYLQKRKRLPLLRLFRSLEVAFHASLFPADGLTSINDIGTRLALWVSAFEILCHSGKGGYVNKRSVQGLLSIAPYTSSKVRARRYTVTVGRGKNKQTFRACLPEKLYDDLYISRCHFLHGEPVTSAMLYYRRSTVRRSC
jgi:hypothetical protein